MKRRLDGYCQRGGARIGTQPQVRAKDIAMLCPVLKDSDEPACQADKEIDGLIGLDDGRRVRIDQHDQVDIGREVQLIGTELAHAKQNPAAAFCRSRSIGELQFARAVGIEKQKIDGGANAFVCKKAQPLGGCGRVRNIGKPAERNQAMRLRLQIAQRLHLTAFGLFLGKGTRIDALEQHFEPFVGRRVEQGFESMRVAARTIAQEWRKLEHRREETR